MSTRIRALGNPLAFLLTSSQAHDLEGDDVLLPVADADTLLADRTFGAGKWII